MEMAAPVYVEELAGNKIAIEAPFSLNIAPEVCQCVARVVED